MDTINTIELRDENRYPDDDVLKSVLNGSFLAYKKLLELFARHALEYEWRYYKDGKAWLCKVQRKKKTIVWMSAWKGFMQAAVYIPEKFSDAIFGLQISEATIETYKATKNVGRSKPCIFKITDESILGDLEIIMLYKIGCQ